MDELKTRITFLIKNQVNPLLESHLGGVVLTSVEGTTAKVKFTGSCANCYAAEDTLDTVVKAIIIEGIPEIEDVIIDEELSDELLDFARGILNKENAPHG